MNQKRKAELQRKLSMMPVPRPPAGLVDRIKADIPDDLAAVAGRTPRSTGFDLRIAASILIVVASTAIVALYILGGREKGIPFAAPRTTAVSMRPQPRSVPEAELTVSVAEPPLAANAARQEALIEESKGNAPQIARAKRRAAQPADQQFAPAAVAENIAADAAADKVEAQPAQTAERAVVGGVVGGAAGGVSSPSTITAAAPVAMPAAPPIAQQAEIASKDASAERGSGRLQGMASKTTALRATPQAPREMFGISIDPDALGRVQKTLESGRRPAAASVDVEAIVSYLGSTPGSPTSGVSFDVEGSRQPDVINSRSAMIRFTIDTARAPAQARSIGSDAMLEIRFDPAAVSSQRILGNGKPLTMTEPMLFDSASVTGVIEVTLNGGLAPSREVATLKLRYRDANRHWQMIQKIVRVIDLQRSWEMASFRHRLATLGAIWSESIRGGTAPAEVARTAEELASEAPRDTRARDLADVANASSRLDGSGSSGSDLR